MTEEEIIDQAKSITTYKWLIGLLGTIILAVFSGFIVDNGHTKDKVDKKADIDYVDKRDAEIKEEAEKKRLEMKADFTAILQEIKDGQAELKNSIDRRNGLDYIKENKPIRK